MSKKTAGIVADNYKVAKFEEKLTDAGLTDYTVTELEGDLAGTSNIAVQVDPEDLVKVHKICKEVELEFKLPPGANDAPIMN